MGSEWQLVRLGDVSDILTGFPFKSQYYTKDGRDPRLIGGDNIVQAALRWDNVRRWPRDMVSGLESYWLAPDDVVLAMDRPWIEAGLKRAAIGAEDLPALLVQRTARLRGTDQLDTTFLRYVIGSREFEQYLLGVQTGTAVPHISLSQIREFRFLLPPIAEQQAIAQALGGLDAKIELNRRTNETLEAMARALFKSWFVDFDPVRAQAEGRAPSGIDETTASLFPGMLVDSELGPIPDGWSVSSVYALAEVDYGAPYASRLFRKDCIGRPVIRIRDLVDQAPDVRTEEVHPRDVVVSAGDILVGMDGEFRATVWAGEPAVLNQRVCRFRPKVSSHTTFLRLVIEPPLRFVEQTEVATTVIHLGKNDIDRFRVLVPSPPVLEAFARVTTKLHTQQIVKAAEARTLALTRDELIPRLLSGEIDVSKPNQTEPGRKGSA